MLYDPNKEKRILAKLSAYHREMTMNNPHIVIFSPLSNGNPYTCFHCQVMKFLCGDFIMFVFLTIGINADGNTYDISDISNALSNGIGQTPGIQCNQDSSGNKQIYQIYACIDKDASTIIQCPVFPSASCSSTVEFPSFAI